MQGDKKRQLRRIKNTPQGGANAVNAANNILVVNQSGAKFLFYINNIIYSPGSRVNPIHSPSPGEIAKCLPSLVRPSSVPLKRDYGGWKGGWLRLIPLQYPIAYEEELHLA